MPYRFAASHFPEILIENFAEVFNLERRGIIQFAVESDNLSVIRDAALHSDITLLTTARCIRTELEAGVLVELPIDLHTPTSWHTVTLKNAVLHPAVASLKRVIEKMTH